MKRATAVRTSYSTYLVRWGKMVRPCPFRFLLALEVGGYRVTIDQAGWDGRVKGRKISRKILDTATNRV